MIDIRNVTYRYGDAVNPALDDVSLENGGGIVAVRGDSGSGKSTLLRLINGLVPHFHGGTIRGRVNVCGLDVLAQSPRAMARHVGFVFQDPETQAVAATVQRDIAFGLGNIAVPRDVMPSRIGEALELVGLSGFERRTLRSLSGGERQRAALAAVIAMRPRVLVLDEPLAQLDDAAANEFVAVIAGLAERGTTVVMAEHRAEITRIATRAIIVDCGRVVDRATSAAALSPVLALQPRVIGDAVVGLSNATYAVDDRRVIDNVTFSASRGDVVTIGGANGAGKTSILRMLAGVLQPTDGAATRSPNVRVAYLPQNPAMMLHRESVGDEVAMALRESHASGDAASWLERFGLTAVASRSAREVSVGQRQRTAIAALCATRPDVILLDEPTRGTDSAARRAVVIALDELARAGTCVIVATHDAALRDALSGRQFALRDGRLHADTDAALVGVADGIHA